MFVVLLVLGVGAGLAWAATEVPGGLRGLLGRGADRGAGGRTDGRGAGGLPSGASRDATSAAPVEITWTAPAEGALVARAVTATVEASGTGLSHLKVSVDVTAGQVLAEQAAPTSDTTSLKVEYRFDPTGLADRTHYLIATAKTSDETTVSVRRAVRVDLTAPTVELIHVRMGGSPNGLYPGKYPYKIGMGVRAKDAVAASLRVVGEIRTTTGATLKRTILRRPEDTITVFFWDGKDSRGVVRPPGTYNFVTRAIDSAGHVSPNSIASMRILSLRDIAMRFPTVNAKYDAERLASFGVRKAGGAAERRAADYIASVFKAGGYTPIRRRVPLKDGGVSQNVIAIKKGSSASVPIIIIGAHMDSRADMRSPGGNDDASGIGVMLETARTMNRFSTRHEIWFVAFGAEEIYDGNPDHHHEGSRLMARTLTASQMARGVRMVNLDMVGVGTHMGIGTQRGAVEGFARYHLAVASQLRYAASFDSHGSGSDHEAFVKRGIPVAYYDWGPDPYYHTPRDTAVRLRSWALQATGQTLVGALYKLAAR